MSLSPILFLARILSRVLRILFRGVVVLYFVVNFLWAEDFQLISEINKHRVLVGEKITLRITLKTPPDQDYRLPILSGKLGGFEIKDYWFVKTPPDKLGGESQTIAYILVGYVVGEQIIPAIRLSHEGIELTTQPILVQVDSVLLGSDRILEPLKPNFFTQGNISVWVYPGVILATVLLFYLIRVFFIFLWRRRQKTYYDTAQVQINKLTRLVVGQGFTKDHYFRLDRIIRTFYAEYQRHPAILSMTSKQVVRYIEQHPSKLGLFFISFFSNSDVIKFGTQTPDLLQCREQIKVFQNIIQEVKKEEEESKSSKQKTKPSFQMDQI